SNHHHHHHATPKNTEWTVDKIASALSVLAEEVPQNHSRLVNFLLEETEKRAPQPRHLSKTDPFAHMKSKAIDANRPRPEGVPTMDVKFKQHSGEYGKSRNSGRRFQYPVVCIKPDREPVPPYRFHHAEIRKNILALNSQLNFVPHLRDVDPNSAEEQKYSAWLMDLENLDSKSGFKIQPRSQKIAKRAQAEYAATLAPYLEPWLRKLNIEGCTKSNLIRFMASQPESDDSMTPQQKSNLLDTYSDDMGSPQAVRNASMFTEAWDRVFNDQSKLRRVALRDILMLDKNVEPIFDNKRAKDAPGSQKPPDEALMQKVIDALGSYTTLGCLICFSHDCEHGEIERDNQKRCFSLEEIGGLMPSLRRKWAAQIEQRQKTEGGSANAPPAHPPCRNECYRIHGTGDPNQQVPPWSENEVGTLEWMFATIGYSQTLRPECFVGAILGRPCWDVHRKLQELDLRLPPVEPRTIPKQKSLPWYDRRKKQLMSDWADATITHEHAVRELFAPCHHDGPCTAANGCPCASAGTHPVLCERFCLCTAEECPLKFTGCACHSSGKTCLQRQREGRPCICVQLNRECDPTLCKGCGARERADPENAYDEVLHSTGCQNVALQRGAAKAVVLGKSQLEACGYGLFAAEDIEEGEFVIEYTGELISHDEGVRREHRRGDVFDEENKVSYLFTLLEQEGIWVDAAIYGNLSRYINHATDGNIMPKIMYVNHEWRIKFTAIKDIKAGEELFFNYGDNFPNLTKKLVERNEQSGAETTPQQPKRANGLVPRGSEVMLPGRGVPKKPLRRPKRRPLLVPKTTQPLFDPLSKVQLLPGQPLPQHPIDDSWLLLKHRDNLQDFIDLRPEEKEFLQEWDAFILRRHISSEQYLPRYFLRFVREKADWLVSKRSRGEEFSKLVATLLARRVLPERVVIEATQVLNDARGRLREQGGVIEG
uniref:Histone-lysine N-methyltransferase EZH2, Polycomb protein SUZ12 n=1 Tax=Thermochaetoides thermophila TaxID=209285 RepID=UPI0006DBD79A|nr:Chain B, Histone-lysine N-methyltransferase EZH2, Polycomb protein SUZ12 [Thermochaetoides thermophila]5KJH_B Chain B, Crystal structure of an active polycomb repressive complex 2 in the stimulated state [Thermochaetoides thermophila DSM 1495]5KJI_B Chain B, Crystal structure of an active polycomb repressive complex 2 in the basal state [Thermochaetoides thermophila DSM 1495]5M5G_B Chain B, Crystal structure of the Chaetomium Thermophilum polycomb repressive complex 2 (PRC2) [Thermochaetoides